MLNRQIPDQTQSSQRNEQIIEIKTLEKPPSNCKTSDEEDARDDGADVPAHLVISKA